MSDNDLGQEHQRHEKERRFIAALTLEYARSHGALPAGMRFKGAAVSAPTHSALPGRDWLFVQSPPLEPQVPPPENLPVGRDWLFRGTRIKGRDILAAVAAQHGVTLLDMSSRRRTARVVRARHEAMWRMRHETPLSYPEIGKLIGGRDHTTVLHGVQAHERRMQARVKP